MNYPWYTVIEQKNDIHQGDFIINCPVVIPSAVFDLKNTPDVDVKTMDAIILTQSCDLGSKNIDNILVCRYFSLSDFFNEIQKNEALLDRSIKWFFI